MMKRLAFAVVCFALMGVRGASALAAPIRVLLIDGESGGTWHNWQLTTPILKKELEEAGLFQVTVMTAPRFGENYTSFQPDFSRYQVIVSNLDSPDWPEDLRTRFERYISNGGGLVVVHAADNAFPKWREYNLMIGVGGWRDRKEAAGPHWVIEDGKQVSVSSPGSAGAHGNRLPFLVTTRMPAHPIMKGLPASWMHSPDELYANLRGPGKNMSILATAYSDPKNKGTGRVEPMLMVISYGKGRIFHTTLGHDPLALSCVGFITTFQRGAEWAATGRVTQKVPAGFATSGTVSYRIDIAEMDPAIAAGTSVTVTPGPKLPPSQK